MYRRSFVSSPSFFAEVHFYFLQIYLPPSVRAKSFGVAMHFYEAGFCQYSESNSADNCFLNFSLGCNALAVSIFETIILKFSPIMSCYFFEYH